MNRWISTSICGTTLALGAALALGATAGAPTAARAQDTPPPAPASFPDVPQNHWAYQAVRDLAAKGYVKGYPDGTFLGQRALTRYEFATVITRMLQTINDLSAKISATPPPTPPAPAAPPVVTPTGNSVTQDDMNKLQALVDSFKTQLEAIGTPIAPVQDQIDAIRQDITDVKDTANKAQDAANNSYGFGGSRKFKITGYVQARFQSADSNDKAMFPQGLGAVTGATGSFNGNYAIGGTKETFTARRVRLKTVGGVSANASYAIQIDAGGFTTNSTAPNNVTIREAHVDYTFGDGDPNVNPTIIAGLWANYFGYELPLSSSDILSPERPLAFNEGGTGLFINQDYDRGVQIATNLGGSDLRLQAALVNGTGLNAITGGGTSTGVNSAGTPTTSVVSGGGNDNNNHLDSLLRVSYAPHVTGLGLGASYYDGRIPRPGTFTPTGAASPIAFTGTNYQEGKKQLYGFDAHYAMPAGLFLAGEYIGGKYDFRSYFTSNTSFKGNQFVPGNKVTGYYVQGGWTFNQTGARPLTAGVSYDVFRRSSSGVNASATDGASGSSFDDVNVGYGALYNLDKQVRLKLWYEKPTKVAHAANVAEPAKVGLYTAELQVKF